MRYAAKLALRHLLATPGQTLLLMLGVAVGVSVFVFMSALIGGLATLLTERTVGNIAHVTLEMADRDPARLVDGDAQVAVQKDLSRREQIMVWEPAVALIEATPGVAAVSPQIRGSAFVQRGQAIAPVGVVGVQPDKLSAIADIGRAMVEGRAALTTTLELKTLQVGGRDGAFAPPRLATFRQAPIAARRRRDAGAGERTREFPGLTAAGGRPPAVERPSSHCRCVARTIRRCHRTGWSAPLIRTRQG